MQTTQDFIDVKATASRFSDLFDRQRAYFNTNITKSYEWRIDQLDRLSRMLSENMDALSEAIGSDFKTALSEKLFEVAAPLGLIEVAKAQLRSWMQPVEAPVPLFLAKSGHKGIVYREPYGVTLIMGPFNGPLLLLLRPAITALAAGNTCILKVSEAPATAKLLLTLIPKYFEPEALAAVSASREETAALLRLPFDFIFFTGSTRVGKIVMRAAAEHLTPVLLELGGQNPAIVDETANLKDAAKKLVWELRHGEGNGVPHLATRTFTNWLRRSSWPNARKRLSNSTATGQRRMPTIRGSSTLRR